MATETSNTLSKRRRCLTPVGLCGLLVLFVATGCGGSRQSRVSDEAPAPDVSDRPAAAADVTAEAYLFDTFIHHNGKRTSVRLELLATDSILAAGGRAYLGKGALKGWIRDDSLHLYFPQSDEFVYEPVADLLQSVSCSGETPVLQLLSFFFETPDSVRLDSQIVLSSDWDNENRPAFQLGMRDCPWQIDLQYDRREVGLRLREFRFDNGDNLRIEAKRREYRSTASVPALKFRLTVPESATQIIP